MKFYLKRKMFAVCEEKNSFVRLGFCERELLFPVFQKFDDQCFYYKQKHNDKNDQ